MNEHPPASDTRESTATTAGSVKAESTPKQRLVVTSLCIAASLSFYVLSAGPMSGLARVIELRSFRKAVEVVYKPLVVIVRKDIRPFSTTLKWYAGLFR